MYLWKHPKYKVVGFSDFLPIAESRENPTVLDIEQIIGIKVYKLPIFIIWQMRKTALNRQIAPIAVEHYTQNHHDKHEYAQSD
ncbi:TPA: hypothetical protein SIC62_001215 [Pasteurella multocida]|uniref:hypothetical protein n=1 Tax=Pasteurella multocida TaxID=747 RepID=UPI00201FBD97|nr:hypothetical protein [Pasteurella multocida]MCL7796810.1 hypothetical protein [Pasteurella multocida]MCL7802580.1 hypothetical protein [Pasteurella multocida]MDG2540613.1 hypothetical protein [Pasteurella multocida]MDY0498292.1 hypothetical protein [Pasteurella multocida]MDY0655145.1 hypothetical protein [Pasteurella multocida]